MILRTIMRSLIALLFLIPALATAQTPSAPAPASDDQLLKPEQLEALVSPIALYPDSLLSNVLMASTYPLEIVQAERWLTRNKNLSGDALKAAVDKQPWDDAVKALVATPPALAMMSSELDWTQKLGDAVLAQQADVMAAIQRLRARAQDKGTLATNAQQTVSVEQGANNQRTVVIEQANDDTVYVPAYDPAVAYGGWPYAEYPPSYWGYPDYWGYGIAPGFLARGLWFGAGWAIGRWGSGSWGWGGRVNWGNGGIIRNWPRATPYNINNINNIGNRVGNNWQHNPAHRGGVRYNNRAVQQRFGGANRQAGGARINHRGAIAAGAAGIGAGAAIRAGQRGHVANRQARTNVGNRQARTNVGNRPAHRAANRPAQRNVAANRARGGGVARSRAGVARGGGARVARGGGGARVARGGGGARVARGGGGRGGGGRGGGGRRSDIALKHDVVLLGHLDNGLGFYRFAYTGSDKAYVGVIAQEVQSVMPAAVVRDRAGYLRVYYDKLGVPFETYAHWIATGARVPAGPAVH
jgi:hypothetical protein